MVTVDKGAPLLRYLGTRTTVADRLVADDVARTSLVTRGDRQVSRPRRQAEVEANR
jgi:hypothetical protein